MSDLFEVARPTPPHEPVVAPRLNARAWVLRAEEPVIQVHRGEAARPAVVPQRREARMLQRVLRSNLEKRGRSVGRRWHATTEFARCLSGRLRRGASSKSACERLGPGGAGLTWVGRIGGGVEA